MTLTPRALKLPDSDTSVLFELILEMAKLLDLITVELNIKTGEEVPDVNPRT